MTSVAVAQPTAPVPPPPPPPGAGARFDPTGWQLLGQRLVTGRRARDTIWVGRYEGQFDQIMLVVEDQDIELTSLKVTFGNRTKFVPRVRQYFREGSRSRAIDLPGANRMIKRIDLGYRRLGRGLQATVQVYGRNKAGGPGPGPVGKIWDSSGWTMIASATVDGRVDRDVIPVGKYAGKFDRVTLVVMDSDMQLADVTFVFGNGERFSPNTRMDFREGTRTRVIDLPGVVRVINRVELAYANKPGDRRRARVEIWGRESGGMTGGGGARPPAPVFDNRGWTMLGSLAVTGKLDHDMIPIGKDEGKFRQLTLVVLDSDVEVDRFRIEFGNGQPLEVPVRHFFKEGSRSRVIDLPGDKRVIKNIHLVYGNTRGGGRARVEVWGR